MKKYRVLEAQADRGWLIYKVQCRRLFFFWEDTGTTFLFKEMAEAWIKRREGIKWKKS